MYLPGGSLEASGIVIIEIKVQITTFSLFFHKTIHKSVEIKDTVSSKSFAFMLAKNW